MTGYPVVAFEGSQEVESGLRSVHHGHRDGLVQRDHGVGRESDQQLVEEHDLPPVRVLCASRLVVDRSDRGLNLVGPDPRSR